MNTKKLLVILAFTAIYFIWGTTYLANIFGLQDMKPFVLSTLRYTAAATIMLVWCFIKKLTFPAGRQLKGLVISGLLMLGGGAGFVVIGEQYINSGHTAVVIATEPLLFLLMDKKGWKTNFSNKWMLAGLLLGFAGIFLFSRFTADPHASAGSTIELIKGTLLVLMSTIFWVSGTLYARKHQAGESSGVADAAVQHLAAAIACFIIAVSLGEWRTFTPSEISSSAWGALAFLVVMGSLVAFIAFSWLMRIKTPAVVSTHTYVNPVVAVIIGCLVAKEQVSTLQIIALVMVLTGVVLTTMKKPAVA